MEQLTAMLNELGLPYAYDHFAEGDDPSVPFICLRNTGTDNFSADGRVFVRVLKVDIELYTDRKDIPTERKLEEALDTMGVFWNREETWIESEKLYEAVYSFEMEG